VARRRPDLYFGTPAELRMAGVDVLPVAGVVSALIGIGFIVLALVFHTNIGLSNSPAIFGISYFHLAIVAPFFAIAVGAVWYYTVKAVKRGQGIDLALNYKSIPPD